MSEKPKNQSSNQIICRLLGIKYPIIQAGMIWVSGAKLAAASANAGVLGVIGAGSMAPELLESQIKKARSLSDGPIAVNFPLLYRKINEQVDVAVKCGIKIFITGAGSPKTFTSYLKDQGGTVIHVTSSPKLAEKCQSAGVDAVIAEGFEAGGHNGRDEITSFVLIPEVRAAVDIPVIAAGGIGTGAGMAAALALGADAVQIGTRFALTKESQAHQNFKQAIVEAAAEDTVLALKEFAPVRLLKNRFFEELAEKYRQGATKDDIDSFVGKFRARDGMHLGDLSRGKLEIGQISGLLNDIPAVAELVPRLIEEYNEAIEGLSRL